VCSLTVFGLKATAGVYKKLSSLGSGVLQTRLFAAWGKAELEQKSAAVSRSVENFRSN
jgi:hypothetical protein